jgi:hypothetical protein
VKPSERHPADLSPDLTSRRRAIRLAAPPGLTVTLSDSRVHARILDISHGGVGLLTNVPLADGGSYLLTFRIGTRIATCSARAAHVNKRPDDGWRAGMAFVQDEQITRVEEIVDELIDGLVQFS